MSDSLNINLAILTGISRSAGGLFYAVSSLCRGLLSRSVHVSVFGPGHDYTDEDGAAWGAVPVTPYPTVGAMGLSIALRRALKKTDAQIVHQHGIWLDNQWAALQWQKRTKNPVVISPHGMLDPWALQNSAWKKKLVGTMFANESLQRATCLHALCRSEADSIRAYGLKNPIAIIPNGVELPEIGRPKSEDGGRKKLLFLGRIHPKKGLSELIHAWSKAKSESPGGFSDWQLLIAGWDDGGYEDGLKALSRQLGLDLSVDFIGSKFGAEKEELLRSVDAFILPSFSEGLPMSVLEAWSYELPVVMTDFCNLPEGFDAGSAVRIEPNTDSISEGLKQLAAFSDGELKRMGSNGRKLVEEQFTWPTIAENMRKVYQWCLTRERPPACMEFYND